MLQQFLSEVLTLSPREGRGGDGDVRWAEGVDGGQVEERTDALPADRGVNLNRETVMSWTAR